MRSNAEPDRLDLSVAIITCNNAATIARTLQSVAPLRPAEVVVVDSGSTDGTERICMESGAKVVRHAWEGHVRQKQFALEACGARWVLSLDSDESLQPELVQEIREALQRSQDDSAGYEMIRRLWWKGRELTHVFQPEWRLRLVRRDAARWTGYDPHDRLEVHGSVRRLRGIIRHDAFADVPDLVRKQVAHGLRAAESYKAMGRNGSLAMLAVSPTAAFLKQMVFKAAFLDGWAGWVCASGAAVSAGVKQMRLLELSRDAQAAQKAREQSPPPAVPAGQAAGAGDTARAAP